jgi:hypothetical protein
MDSLTQYVEKLREDLGGRKVPGFDPEDGGTNAKVLFLLHWPSDVAVGTGMVSTTNPDSTAKNMGELLAQSNIDRKDVMIWNVVPWHVGQPVESPAKLEELINEALPHLKCLLRELRDLRLIVLLGAKARHAKKSIHGITHVEVITLDIPTQRVFNKHPAKGQQVKDAFERIANICQED